MVHRLVVNYGQPQDPGAFDEPGVPGPDGEHPTSTTDPDGETVLEDACAS